MNSIAPGLFSIGIPKDAILKYETSIKAGKFLLIVHGTPDEATRTEGVLVAAGASNVHPHISGTPAAALA